MAVTIKLTGGVDFNAYIQTFDDSFKPGGFGFFSDGLGGDEYALTTSESQDLPIEGGQTVIVDSGSGGDLAYNMQTHTVGGVVDSVEFGSGLVDSNGKGDYSTDGAIKISGLGLSGEGPGNDVSKLLGQLRVGDAAFLLEQLNKTDIALKGSADDDVFVSFGGNDKLAGGKGDDTINGKGGDDQIAGGAGDDKIIGGGGNDELNGSVGDDKLVGGGGADTLAGGAGDDRASGGAGDDLFVFAGKNFGHDVVTGFEGGPGAGDQLQFSAKVFDSFEDVLDAARETRGGVMIEINENASVLLKGADLSDLHASDFLFA